MPRSYTPPLQLVPLPTLTDQHEIQEITWSDGIKWKLWKFLGTDILQPLIPPGPDGVWGTADDPIWFPPNTPGNPAAWNQPLPPGKRIIQIPPARWARVSAVYLPHSQGRMIPTQIVYDKCPPAFPGRPWQVLTVHPSKERLPGEPPLGSPFHDLVHPGNMNMRWSFMVFGIGETFFGLIPMPNPFYAFFRPTDIEIQKRQIDKFFSPVFRQCIEQGFPTQGGDNFRQLDSNYVRDLLNHAPQYPRLLPAMTDGMGDICSSGLDIAQGGDGMVERTINQFLANCARHKWTPEQSLQCWRACAYDINKYKLIGLVPGLSTQPPQGPWPGTKKPPGWQGAWPGNWQALRSQIVREIPNNPFCYEIPLVPEIQTNVNIAYLKVTPATIVAGQSATLSWSVDNAVKVTLSPGTQNVAFAGEMVVHPTRTTTYNLLGQGSHGDTDQEIVALTVTAAGPAKPAGWQGPWPPQWPAQQPSWWPGNWQWPPPRPTQSTFNWPLASQGTTFPQTRPPYWPQTWRWPPPKQPTIPPPQQGPPCWQGPYPVPWPQAKPPWWPQSWPWPPRQPSSINFPWPQPPYNWPFPQAKPPWWPQPWVWPPIRQAQPIPGPRGPAGPRGAPGARGPIGPRGPQGPEGECECEIPPPLPDEWRNIPVFRYDFRNLRLFPNRL